MKFMSRKVNNEQKQAFKALWKEFYTGVAVHGFRHIFEEKGMKRLIWIILCGFCVVLSFYLVQGIFLDYSKLRTVAISREIFSHGELLFPTFSMCPFNSFRYKQSSQEMANENGKNIFKNLNKYLHADKYDNFSRKLNETLADLGKSSILEFLQLFELSMDEIIKNPVIDAIDEKSCMFNGQPCDASNFTIVYPINENYGYCYQFNAYKVGEKSRTTSASMGLKLVLNIRTDLPVLLQERPYHGMAVFIHPFGSPVTKAYSEFIPVSPGTLNTLFMKKTERVLLPPPYDSECGQKEYKFVDPEFPYTKAMCELDCMAKHLFTSCRCLGYEYQNYVKDQEIICTDAYDYVRCKKNYTDYLGSRSGGMSPYTNSLCFSEINSNSNNFGKNRDDDGITEDCADNKKCPMECSTVQFRISASHTTFGTRRSFERITKIPKWNKSTEETKEYVSSNIIGINVQFSDPTTTHQDIVPTVTMRSAIGSVGGSLGLCLGFSIVTIFEFLYFLFTSWWDIFKIKKKKVKETFKQEEPDEIKEVQL